MLSLKRCRLFKIRGFSEDFDGIFPTESAVLTEKTRFFYSVIFLTLAVMAQPLTGLKVVSVGLRQNLDFGVSDCLGLRNGAQ